jgi:hypothetical protein
MNESSRFNKTATISKMEITCQSARREASLRDCRIVDVTTHMGVSL